MHTEHTDFGPLSRSNFNSFSDRMVDRYFGHEDLVHWNLFGTANSHPQPQCDSIPYSGQLLYFDSGAVCLIDCGEATQLQMMRARVKFGALSLILITHLHGDHCLGLPGLLCTLSLQGRTDPLCVVGPIGLKHLVDAVLTTTQSFLTYELELIELDPAQEDTTHQPLPDDHRVVRRLMFSIRARTIVHRVPCFGYCFEQLECARKVQLDPEKLREYRVPRGPLCGALARGEDVTLEDSTLVRSADVCKPLAPLKKIVVLGDTSDASNIADLARGCCALVHEATFDASMREMAIDRGHSTTEMAAKFALDVGAKKLIINHFSCRYFQGGQGLKVEDLEREAQEIMGDVPVIAANDLDSVTV